MTRCGGNFSPGAYWPVTMACARSSAMASCLVGRAGGSGAAGFMVRSVERQCRMASNTAPGASASLVGFSGRTPAISKPLAMLMCQRKFACLNLRCRTRTLARRCSSGAGTVPAQRYRWRTGDARYEQQAHQQHRSGRPGQGHPGAVARSAPGRARRRADLRRQRWRHAAGAAAQRRSRHGHAGLVAARAQPRPEPARCHYRPAADESASAARRSGAAARAARRPGPASGVQRWFCRLFRSGRADRRFGARRGLPGSVAVAGRPVAVAVVRLGRAGRRRRVPPRARELHRARFHADPRHADPGRPF